MKVEHPWLAIRAPRRWPTADLHVRLWPVSGTDAAGSPLSCNLSCKCSEDSHNSTVEVYHYLNHTYLASDNQGGGTCSSVALGSSTVFPFASPWPVSPDSRRTRSRAWAWSRLA